MLLSFGKPAGKFVSYHKPQCHLEIRPLPTPPQAVTSDVASTGYEMLNSFKLSAMELSGESWAMRQMAVYHSLNLQSGRSFTLTVKANHKEIASRIKSVPLGGEKAPSTMSECFSASLETQLLGFGWCVEGWADYIDKFEQKLHAISQRVAGIPMPQEEELVKRLTKKVEPKAQDNSSSTRKLIPPFFRSSKDDAAVTDPTADTTAAPGGIEMDNMGEELKTEDEGVLKRIERAASRQIEALRAFPFDGLQEIHISCTKLREVRLVIDLNRQAMCNAREHYKAAFASDIIPQEIKESCSAVHRSFQQRVKYLEDLLAIECLRIDTITQVASDGNGLVSKSRD